jgi:DNA-binding response OmpR family regulator
VSGPKILIIDDDKALVALLTHTLRGAGYQVLAAVDPVQGLMSAKREAPALVILDLVMPAGGGMPVLERLSFGGSARVVVMTASSDPKLEGEAKSHGAAGFVKKPVDPSALRALVDELLGPPAG